MSEERVMEATDILNTIESLKKDFLKLGLKKGMTVIVHSSLSSIGWVCGGEVAVIEALIDILTKEGTLVMPSQTVEYSEPCYWCNPTVPDQWYDTIKNTMPAFDKEITPCRAMGRIVETFRKFPGVVRSNHPQASFIAWGKNAELITENQKLNDALGESSPLGKIYKLNGYILLIGVGYEKNTSFHLSEYKSKARNYTKFGSPIMVNGKREWVEFRDLNIDTYEFERIGKEFEEKNKKEKNIINTGIIGQAYSKLINQPTAVDFATNWFIRKKQTKAKNK